MLCGRVPCIKMSLVCIECHQMNENRSNNVGQYILVQRTPNVAPRASSAPPSNQNTNVVSIRFYLYLFFFILHEKCTFLFRPVFLKVKFAIRFASWGGAVMREWFSRHDKYSQFAGTIKLIQQFFLFNNNVMQYYVMPIHKQFS